jgi:ubiquinone/menaquinone biosynthesis C-methylase UbiE
LWASLIEGLRKRRCPPEERVAEVGIGRGTRVVDVGAGYGFFSFPAARVVGDEGFVYAVEPNHGRAAEISREARKEGVKNLRVVETGAEDLSAIATAEVDVVMSMSSLHHFNDAKKGLVEMKRVVKQGGIVYIRDIKSGKVFKHGSRSGEFRRVISETFPNAQFEEGSHYMIARIRL